MKKKHIAVIIGAVIVLFVCCIFGANALLTNLIESTNVVCKDQKFSSAEEALQAMEADERKQKLLDTSLEKQNASFNNSITSKSFPSSLYIVS